MLNNTKLIDLWAWSRSSAFIEYKFSLTVILIIRIQLKGTYRTKVLYQFEIGTHRYFSNASELTCIL